MAARIRELRHSDLGKVLVAQQTAEAAMNSLYDPVIVTDAAGRVQRINAAAEPLFGHRGLGAESADRGGRAGSPGSRCRSSTCCNPGESAAPEETAAFVPLVVDGVERAFRQRTTPMRAADGARVGAVMLLEDITHLREIDRLKSEFIAGASHELRTPLTSLEMGVHLLLEGVPGELSARQLEILTMCRDDATRLDTLVKELLDLSRLESGRGAPQLEIGRASTTSSTERRSRCAATPSPPGSRCGSAFPGGAAARAGGPSQVERVMANLVTNAVRATSPGGRDRGRRLAS